MSAVNEYLSTLTGYEVMSVGGLYDVSTQAALGCVLDDHGVQTLGGRSQPLSNISALISLCWRTSEAALSLTVAQSFSSYASCHSCHVNGILSSGRRKSFPMLSCPFLKPLVLTILMVSCVSLGLSDG